MNDDYIFTSAIRPQDLFGPTCAGAKNATFGSHLYINDHFTKTGSGQTYRENTLKQDDYLLLTVFLRSFFECFPYVCPEPVLVNSSVLYINGFKKWRFSHNRHPAAARARRGEAPLRQRDCGHASKRRPHLGQLGKRENMCFFF